MQKVRRFRTCSKRCNAHRPSPSLSEGYGYHLFVQAMYVCVCVCICTHAWVVLLLGVINRPHFNGAKQIITLRLMMENAGRVECTYGGRTGKRVYTFDKLFNLATIEISLRSRTHHGSCTEGRQSSNTRAMRRKKSVSYACCTTKYFNHLCHAIEHEQAREDSEQGDEIRCAYILAISFSFATMEAITDLPQGRYRH